MQNSVIFSGGIIFLIIFISSLKNSFILSHIGNVQSDFVAVLLTLLFSVFASSAIGFIINQLWKTAYNLFFDIHAKIFPIKIKSKTPNKLIYSKKISNSMRNEILLALSHRIIGNDFSEKSLQWHRNRLSDIHQNGTIIFSIIFSIIITNIYMNSLGENSYIYNSTFIYLCKRYIFVMFLLFVILSAIYRLIRSYRMLVVFNKIIIYHKYSKNNIDDFIAKAIS